MRPSYVSMSKGPRRFTEEFSFRASAKHRAFLDKYAEEHGINFCAAARLCIDEMMKNEEESS